MAGFLETFVRYVEAFDSDPVEDAAAAARGRGEGRRPRDRRRAEARAEEIEQINWVLRWKEAG